MKILIVYFSQTGHTRIAAEKLAEAIEGDIFEIKPEVPYTEKDLDGYNESSRTYNEQHDPNSRPVIKGIPDKLEKYDILFIGFPIWWYIAPRLVYTFIDSVNLTGKIVIPFATSYESTIEKSCNELKKTYPQITWGNEKLLNQIKKDDLKEWINNLNL